MKKPIALIVGVGPATGRSVCTLLADQYELALVARSPDIVQELENSLSDTQAYQCDVSDRAKWEETLRTIVKTQGTPSRILINTESAAWGEYSELSLDRLLNSFEVNAVALLHTVQVLFPDKTTIPADTRIIISSSPAAYTPPAHFLGLAPSRVAQRVLAELLDENLRPYGLEFSVFSIDGAINEPKMRAMFPNEPDSFFIQPDDIAKEIIRLFQSDNLSVATGISGESSFAKRT